MFVVSFVLYSVFGKVMQPPSNCGFHFIWSFSVIIPFDARNLKLCKANGISSSGSIQLRLPLAHGLQSDENLKNSI